MTTIQYGVGATTISGYSLPDDFTITEVAADELITSASSGSVSYGGVEGTGNVSASVRYKNDLQIADGPNGSGISVESLTPAICTIATDGTIGYVADGICTVEVIGKVGKKCTTQTIFTGAGSQTYFSTVTGFSAGSLRKYLNDQRDIILDGVTPGGASQRVGLDTTGTLGAGMNPNHFLKQSPVGFDGVNHALLEQVLDQRKTWITPHHYLTWYGHGMGPSGTNGAGDPWLCPDGEIIVQYSTATWGGTLAKLPPEDFFTGFAPALPQILQYVPVWIRLTWTYSGSERYWVQPIDAHRNGLPLYAVNAEQYSEFQRPDANGKVANSGDSGSPVFVLIKGHLVILGHTVGQHLPYTQGYFARNKVRDIQAAVDSLDGHGPYTVEVIDLDALGFTRY